MSQYRTPPGVDEKVIDYPPRFTEEQVKQLQDLGIYFIDWNGWTLALGTGMTVEIFNDIKSRLRQIRSVVIAITGPPGEGKTWFGMRLAQIFDPAFDVKKQVCFSREQVAKIISEEIKLKIGQAVLIDEAHVSAGARHWSEEIQKEIIDEIATIRSKGYIVIIVVLHISMLDKILRNFVLTYQFHMEERGVASVYELFTPRFEYKVYHPGRGKVSLNVPWYEICPSPDCLKCEYLSECSCGRAIYERMKKEFVIKMGKETLQKTAKRKSTLVTTREKLEILYKNRYKLKFNKRGNIDSLSVQQILEENGIHIGMTQALKLAKQLLWEHPELKNLQHQQP